MMYSGELTVTHKVALSMTKGVTAVVLRRFAECEIDWERLFAGGLHEISLDVGMRHPLQDCDLQEALRRAADEVEFMSRHHIRALFLLDDDFPYRMYDMADAPTLLYTLGDADMSAERMVAMVGTRGASALNVELTRRYVADFAQLYPDVTIVSGLAYGIDAAAHAAALESGLPTIAVVAHGLSMIYPARNRDLARGILSGGGAIVSEYPFAAKPYQGHFLERNRIVAAMTDATIVMESAVKGGAMCTARCAREYDREVLAVPGRPCDEKSQGCNLLIKRNVASLMTSSRDLGEALGWRAADSAPAVQQKSLFPELEGDYMKVYKAVADSESPRQLDGVVMAAGLPVARVMAILSEMEFDGLLLRHPGNRYSVI